MVYQVSLRDLAIDVTIVKGDSSYSKSDPTNIKKNLDTAEQEKNLKHKAKCNAAGIDFYPFAIDNKGHFAPSATMLLNAISDIYAGAKHMTRSYAKTLIKNRIVFAIERAEAHGIVEFLTERNAYVHGSPDDGLDFVQGEASNVGD